MRALPSSSPGFRTSRRLSRGAAEHALDPVYAKNIGVDVDNLYISQPDNGEHLTTLTLVLLPVTSPLCLSDSILLTSRRTDE